MNKNRYNKEGGEAIASGGFGCVFSPALKCKNNKGSSKHKISKLMIKKYAFNEYNEINKFLQKLNTIPNYENYFLINDFELCEPAPLDENDLQNFKKKCTALPKNNITEKNINQSLDKVLALNMPYGGTPIDDFVQKNINYHELSILNNSLIQLLKNGILQMNKKNIYHCDIKDSTILFLHVEGNIETNKTDNIKCRLIDWGLATEYIPFKEESFPSVWRNRPLQFNVPFSIILFTDDFLKKYTDYLEQGGQINYTSLKPFIMDYIYVWLKTRGRGHYNYINHIMYLLFSEDLKNIQDEKIKTRVIESDFTLFYLSNYLIEILIHYTHFRENGTLNLRVYLDTVFIEILDVFGWITSYLPIFELLYENYGKLNSIELNLFNTFKHIFIKYLYNPRTKPIDVNELIKDMKRLDDFFQASAKPNSTIENIAPPSSRKENKTNSSRKGVNSRDLSLRSNTTKETSFSKYNINHPERILKSTKQSRLLIKNNRTKRNKYLLFANLKKNKRNEKTKKLI